MPTIPPTVIVICPKTQKEVTVKTNCFNCDKLEGVGLQGQFGVDITCDGNKRTVQLFLDCCKDKQKVDVRQKCFLCPEFSHLTFHGQEIRLFCKFTEPPPKDYTCNICALLVEDPEEQMWAEDEDANHPGHKGICHQSCCNGNKGPLVWNQKDLEDVEENEAEG